MSTLEVKDIGADDEPALFRLFTAVRSEELRMDCWDPHLRTQMLRLQFDAQRRSYRERWPDACERLIIHDGSPVGWVIVDRSGDVLRGIDMALVPECRSLGIGSDVIRALLDEAARSARPFAIAVLRTNVRARALYVRLGFSVTGETDSHTLMEWRHDSRSSHVSAADRHDLQHRRP
jgi:ribosomal protein S18 acetylase RimI-like enzyme